MALVVLRDRLDAAGLGEKVLVDSTGISDEERGNPIDRRAARVLKANGYDVPRHQARRVNAGELAEQDLVLAMTSAHARALRRVAGDASVLDGRLRMFRSFDPDAPVGGPEHELDVDDPWYGDQEGFEVTLAEIEAAADGIVDHVRGELVARGLLAAD